MSHHIHKTSMKHTSLVLATLFGIWLPSAEAATWYVATTGTDGTSCGTSAAPCAKANYVLDNKVSAGDTIKVRGGTYTNQGAIGIDNTTTHDNLTLTADDQSNRPLFQNTSIAIANGVSGATVSYLRVQGASGPFGGWSSGLIDIREYPTVIDNCEIFNGFWGISINTSKKVTISNTVIHDIGVAGDSYDAQGIGIINDQRDPAAAGWAERIYMKNVTIYNINSGDGSQEASSQHAGQPYSVQYVEWDGCEIYNVRNSGGEQALDWKGTHNVRIHGCKLHDSNMGIGSNTGYGGQNNFEIWNNQIYGMKAYAIYQQDASNWTIWNNVIYDNMKDSSWSSWGFYAVDLYGDNTSFVYNVLHANNTSSTVAGGIESKSSSNILRNNIFYGNATNGRGNILGGSLGAITNNYVYPPTPGITGSSAVTVSNPGLANPVGREYALVAGSPNIDTGYPLSGYPDFIGNGRPAGTGYDIGALEFLGQSPSALQPPANLRLAQ